MEETASFENANEIWNSEALQQFGVQECRVTAKDEDGMYNAVPVDMQGEVGSEMMALTRKQFFCRF